MHLDEPFWRNRVWSGRQQSSKQHKEQKMHSVNFPSCQVGGLAIPRKRSKIPPLGCARSVSNEHPFEPELWHESDCWSMGGGEAVGTLHQHWTFPDLPASGRPNGKKKRVPPNRSRPFSIHPDQPLRGRPPSRDLPPTAAPPLRSGRWCAAPRRGTAAPPAGPPPPRPRPRPPPPAAPPSAAAPCPPRMGPGGRAGGAKSAVRSAPCRHQRR